MDIITKINNYLNEGKLSKEQQEELNNLLSALRTATDPDYEPDEDEEFLDPEDIIDTIRKKFGDKIADQASNVEAGHWPRKNHTDGYDKLEWRKPLNKNRVTKAGKMNKQDIKGLKSTIKFDRKNA